MASIPEDQSTHKTPPNDFFHCYSQHRYFPAYEHQNLRLSAHLTDEDDLSVLLEMDEPLGVISIMYPIDSYPRIAEFRRLCAEPLGTGIANGKKGQYFFVFTAGRTDRVYWQGRGHGITICVTPAQWDHIRELFDAAFANPDYARAWTRLAAQNGRG